MPDGSAGNAVRYSFSVQFGLTHPGLAAVSVSNTPADFGEDVPTCVVMVTDSRSVVFSSGVVEVVKGTKGTFLSQGGWLDVNTDGEDTDEAIQTKLDQRLFETSACSVQTAFKTVECQSSAGFGTDHLWQLNVSNMLSNIAPFPTSYAPPTIIGFDANWEVEVRRYS